MVSNSMTRETMNLSKTYRFLLAKICKNLNVEYNYLMETKNTSETNSIEGSQEPRTYTATTELANLIGADFSDRIEDHWEEWEQLSRNWHMKSFVIAGKKYIAIIWENKQHEGRGDMPDDIKAWYGAVLEWYKIISEYMCSLYLPGTPPYEIKYPKALAYKHTDDADLLIIEWVDNLVSLDDIQHYRVDVPNKHIEPINIFLDDWADAIDHLSQKSGIRKSSSSKSRHWQFIVKMPYGDVIVNDDFWLRLNDNGAQEQLLKNGWYILGKKADEKPVLYLTDGLIASNMKPNE